MANVVTVTPTNTAFGATILLGINSFCYAVPAPSGTGSVVTYTKIGNNIDMAVNESVSAIELAFNT